MIKRYNINHVHYLRASLGKLPAKIKNHSNMHQWRNTECQFNICQFGHRNSSFHLIFLQLSNSFIFGFTITKVEHVNEFADMEGLNCESIYPRVLGRQNVRREMRRRNFKAPYTLGWVIVWCDCLVLCSSAFIVTIFHSLSMA